MVQAVTNAISPTSSISLLERQKTLEYNRGILEEKYKGRSTIPVVERHRLEVPTKGTQMREAILSLSFLSFNGIHCAANTGRYSLRNFMVVPDEIAGSFSQITPEVGRQLITTFGQVSISNPNIIGGFNVSSKSRELAKRHNIDLSGVPLRQSFSDVHLQVWSPSELDAIKHELPNEQNRKENELVNGSIKTKIWSEELLEMQRRDSSFSQLADIFSIEANASEKGLDFKIKNASLFNLCTDKVEEFTEFIQSRMKLTELYIDNLIANAEKELNNKVTVESLIAIQEKYGVQYAISIKQEGKDVRVLIAPTYNVGGVLETTENVILRRPVMKNEEVIPMDTLKKYFISDLDAVLALMSEGAKLHLASFFKIFPQATTFEELDNLTLQTINGMRNLRKADKTNSQEFKLLQKRLQALEIMQWRGGLTLTGEGNL